MFRKFRPYSRQGREHGKRTVEEMAHRQRDGKLNLSISRVERRTEGNRVRQQPYDNESHQCTPAGPAGGTPDRKSEHRQRRRHVPERHPALDPLRALLREPPRDLFSPKGVKPIRQEEVVEVQRPRLHLAEALIEPALQQQSGIGQQEGSHDDQTHEACGGEPPPDGRVSPVLPPRTGTRHRIHRQQKSRRVGVVPGRQRDQRAGQTQG